MCCRYWADDSYELRAIVEEMNRSPLVGRWQRTTGITTSGEVRPTNVVPVIAPGRTGARAVFPMKWGFTSGGTARKSNVPAEGGTTASRGWLKGSSSLLINARTETAAVKPTFREAWTRHRCIIPAAYYFEWEHLVRSDGKKTAGEKYMIQPKGSAMTWMCGLYRIEEGLPVFVILTRDAGEEIRFIHDRMPLIMPETLIDEWIRPDARPEELVGAALTDMAYAVC